MRKALLDTLLLAVLSAGATSSGLILASYTDMSTFTCVFSTTLVYMAIAVSFLTREQKRTGYDMFAEVLAVRMGEEQKKTTATTGPSKQEEGNKKRSEAAKKRARVNGRFV